MGKVYDSLLSGTSGRTGKIVVANMFGNEVSKIRPRRRTSAPTPKQQLIQQRMTLSAEFMQSYRGYACQHFGKRIGMKSCYNLAMTNLMSSFVIACCRNHHAAVPGHLLLQRNPAGRRTPHPRPAHPGNPHGNLAGQQCR